MSDLGRYAAVAWCLTFSLGLPEAGAAPKVYAIDEGARVLQQGERIDVSVEAAIELSAFRGETVAFQLVIEADDDPLEAVTLTLDSPRELSEQAFVEHFVEVGARSRNTLHEDEALPFRAAARPPDLGLLGGVPDALIPLGLPSSWAYPLTLRPGQRAAFYLEFFVPEDAPPGKLNGVARIHAVDRSIGQVPFTIRVAEQRLPYQAVPAFAFYERSTLERRFLDPDAVERQLAQLLHAHGLDPIGQVVSAAQVTRVLGLLEGSWFATEAGYRGPGRGWGSKVLPIGAYGTLGEPSPQTLDTVRSILANLPAGERDVFVYAVDEQCESPRGPSWRRALREAGISPKIMVGHTCHLDPASQDVDLVMMPAQAFDPDRAEAARALGKRVFVYNGQLPHAAPPVLDVPLTALTLNGWIGASFAVDRWFYWETIFWLDGNRGGRGASDVFAHAETFHNGDGDTSLYDGLLLFPGRSPDAHDLGFDGVVPSLRLKSLRRGQQDAGLLAMAAHVDAEKTFQISKRIVERAFDEADPAKPSALTFSALALREARHELRALAERGPTELTRAEVDGALAHLRSLRRADRQARGLGETSASRKFGVLVGLPALLLALGGLSAWWLGRAVRKRAGRILER